MCKCMDFPFKQTKLLNISINNMGLDVTKKSLKSEIFVESWFFSLKEVSVEGQWHPHKAVPEVTQLSNTLQAGLALGRPGLHAKFLEPEKGFH